MENTLTAATLKRRGMAAIEEGLRHGPVHIIKRNRPAAVVLSEEEYRRLSEAASQPIPGMTALEWLLSQPGLATRDPEEIDASLASDRAW
jgi:prevent-host-death family protein